METRSEEPTELIIEESVEGAFLFNGYRRIAWEEPMKKKGKGGKKKPKPKSIRFTK